MTLAVQGGRTVDLHSSSPTNESSVLEDTGRPGQVDQEGLRKTPERRARKTPPNTLMVLTNTDAAHQHVRQATLTICFVTQRLADEYHA
jgi:hypothetical protein